MIETPTDLHKWGGATGIRTPDLLHAMQALYQLSYSPSAAATRTADGASPVYKIWAGLRSPPSTLYRPR